MITADDTGPVTQPQVTESPDEETQFAIALRRILGQGCDVDPESACAPFNSAF